MRKAKLNVKVRVAETKSTKTKKLKEIIGITGAGVNGNILCFNGLKSQNLINTTEILI